MNHRNEARVAAAHETPQEGRRYRFTCGNAFIDGRIITGFSGDVEAAAFASNYEAVCSRIDADGKETIIYDPVEVDA